MNLICFQQIKVAILNCRECRKSCIRHREINNIGICKNLPIWHRLMISSFHRGSFSFASSLPFFRARFSSRVLFASFHHFLPPLFIIEGTWAEVYALSDQKHENAGEPRLRPAETMKANTGNGKLADTKEQKSGHCELQRTAWKSTVDIQFGQTRGTNKKKREEEKKKRTEQTCTRPRQLWARERSPILPKTTDFEPISTIADVTVICPIFPDVRQAGRGWESIAAKNNLQSFEPDVSVAVYVKEKECDMLIEFIRAGIFVWSWKSFLECAIVTLFMQERYRDYASVLLMRDNKLYTSHALR